MSRGDFSIILPGQGRKILQTFEAEREDQPESVDGGGVLSIVASYRLLSPILNSTTMGPGFAPGISYNYSADPDPPVADMDDLSLEIDFMESCDCGGQHGASMDFVRGTSIVIPARIYSLYVVYPRNPLVAIETQPPIRADATVGRGTMRDRLLPRKTLRFADVPAGVIATPQRIPRFASFVYFENPTPSVLDAPVVFRGGSNGPDIHGANVGKRMEGATLVPNGVQYVTIDNTLGVAAVNGARLVFVLAL